MNILKLICNIKFTCIIILTLLTGSKCFTQIDAGSVMGIPSATTTEIQNITGANEGSLMYSTNEDVYYYFNGATWITVGFDNLGNHIQNQNLQTNGNWISGDGADEGIFVDNNSGNVGISNIPFTPQRQFHIAGTNGGIRLDRFGNDAFFFFVNMNNAGTSVIHNWAFVNDDDDNSFQIRNYGTAVSGLGLGNTFVLKQSNQLQLPFYGTPTTFDDNTAPKLLAIQNDGDVVQVTNTLGTVYEKMAIWAEEAASLTSNPSNNSNREWSFGDSADGNIGIPLIEDWEIYGVAFNSNDNNNSTNITVNIGVMNTATSTELFNFSATGGGNMIYTEILTTPVNVSAGTSIGFRTNSVRGNVSDARVVVYLRRKP